MMKALLLPHLQDQKRARVFCYPPPICFGNVLHSGRRYTLDLKPVVIILQILDDLCTADIYLPKITKEVPEPVLQSNLIGV